MTRPRTGATFGAFVAAAMLAVVAATTTGGAEDAGVAPPTATADMVDTSIRLDGDVVTLRHGAGKRVVGDPIPLLVVAESSDGAVATIELPDDGRLGPFDFVVRPAPRLPDLPLGSAVVSLELSTFESGVVELPPIKTTFERRDGAIRTLATAPLELAVESVLTEKETSDPLAAVRPIKAATPMRGPAPDRSAIWWLASIGLTTAALVGGFLLLSRRRPAAEPPPAAWARERLAALRSDDPAMSPADRWASAAAVLRGLLERRDGLDALERTTAEIARALDGDARFDAAERGEILELLRQADLAKFAGTADRDVESALDAIERLVERGEQRDAVPAPEAAP